MLDSWSSAIYSFVGWSQSTSPILYWNIACLYQLNDQLYLVNFSGQNCGTYIRYRLYNRNRLLSRNYDGRLDFAICQGDPLILSNNIIALSVRCQLLVILTAKRWRQEPPRVLFFRESMFTWIDQPIRAHRSATNAYFFQRVNLCPNINKVAPIMLLAIQLSL